MRTFNSTEQAKIKQLVTEGTHILADVAALKEGLKDAVDAVSEELDIRPPIFNKAIRVAYKAEFERQQAAFSELEEILLAAGIGV
jgi:hypothetical protein